MIKVAFDFKKEYKEFYMPPAEPVLVTVPPATYVAVRGRGDPNAEDGAYKAAVGVLYTVAYTVKMSKLGDRRMEGYYDFVVPPLEGFWWQEEVCGVDYSRKEDFNWISVIRLPEFVTEAELRWAAEEATRKKKTDCASAELLRIDEGLCVQIMHTGPFDDEPRSVALMDAFIAERGLENDMDGGRLHHEIYLSDARKTPPEKQRTVIRHPVRRI